MESDTIIQIACIVTDGDLVRCVEGEEITIHQPEEVLAGMNAWCVDHHGRSGLTQAVRASEVSMAEAEARTLEFIRRHVPDPSAAQIAGNSVHADVAFMKRFMPRIVDYLHYRIVDVSSVGELCRRWFPREYGRAPRKSQAHTAMSDIRESIEQLRYYRQAVFKQPPGMNKGR